MTIPTTQYPARVDTDNELFLVHDSLRLTLAEDWKPGDTHLVVYDNEDIMSRFPPTGTITLVEQCSEVEFRAVGFHYSSKTTTSFEGLEVLPGYEHVSLKPKDYTHVIQSVSCLHHDNLKDAMIAIERFVGLKGTVARVAGVGTLTERLNLLKSLAFQPRAWFVADVTIGMAPLTVTFTNQSVRVGPGSIKCKWDYGDGVTQEVTLQGEVGEDVVGSPVSHVYEEPGKYTVSLSVSNEYGRNRVVFTEMITVRTRAPLQAVVDIVPSSGQFLVQPGLPEGGPYTEQTPILRTQANIPVKVKILAGENPANPGYSYGGEALDAASHPIDPIAEYIWDLGDEVPHPSAASTEGIYGAGGKYDLHLKCETIFGSYRFTNYVGAVDVVERMNLWLWTFDQSEQNVTAHEFGLTNETFKAAASSYSVGQNSTFLDGSYNEKRAKQEFRRNVAYVPRSVIPSGEGGTAMLFWASGRYISDSPSSEQVLSVEYDGFADVYLQQPSFRRPWNWACFSSKTDCYFILGGTPAKPVPNTNPTNPLKTSLNFSTMTGTSEQLTLSELKNGADDLLQNVTRSYDSEGVPLNGYFSTYRTCWHNGAGYLLRNNNVGKYFEMRDFYRTEGMLDEEFHYLTKLPSMLGSDKRQGQLVSLATGVFFFNNSGSMSAYDPNKDLWEVGGPSSDSVYFSSLQDVNAKGFASLDATLLAESDGDSSAYLSFDYSPKTFVKFDALTLTFNALPARPAGRQFIMGVH